LVCSLGLAILLNQKIFARNFFRTVNIFPYVASLVAVAAVWNMLFSPAMGPINQLLASFGVENLPKWAAGKDTAMLTVILFSVWKNMGYYMVIYLAGLQGVNPELYEAADLDGANGWRKFWNVTLPQLAPTTFFVTIMVTISSFKVYDQIYMITQGGPGTSTMVLVYQIYNEAFVGTPEYGYASAISMVLFALVLTITIIQFKGGQDNTANKKKKRLAGKKG
ncbi:MAG: sugar ABC transporter permease, partial [Oscillospiraceae bacterium]|nr:sugar ABC transporter permease [Oscillospiraceae bacterium]